MRLQSPYRARLTAMVLAVGILSVFLVATPASAQGGAFARPHPDIREVAADLGPFGPPRGDAIINVNTFVQLIGTAEQGAEFGWGTATLIETDDRGNAEGPHVALDTGGNAVVVWLQKEYPSNSGGGNVYANRFVPGTGWGTPTRIEMDPHEALESQVAVDPGGNAIAVWSESGDVQYSIWANRFVPASGWGNETLIETDDTSYADFPNVGVDEDGNAIAVWSQYSGATLNVYANRFVPGSGWGNATLIETDAGDAWFPRVAVDPAGNAVVVWQQAKPSGGGSDIWANRFVRGTGWGNATLIMNTESGDAGSPHVGVDAAGSAVAVWHQGGTQVGARVNIWANRYVPGRGWGNETLIETDDAGDAYQSHIAVGPDGGAVAAWWQSDGMSFNVYANRFVPGTGWGNATQIEAGDADNLFFRPHVAMDAYGNAMVVWYRSDGVRLNIWANRYVPGRGWGNETLIETDDAGDAVSPDIAMDSVGNAVAVWTQSDGTRRNIWANRFVRDLVPPDLVLASPGGDFTNNPEVTVAGTTEPGATLTVDGTPAMVAEDGSFTYAVTLPDGPHTFVVVATDAEGNEATASVTITVDTAAPAPAITAPTSGALLAIGDVEVHWTASDAGSGIDYFELTLDTGTPVVLPADATAHTFAAVADGSHTIVMTAFDLAGNMASDSVSVTVDTTPPTVSVDVPADGAILGTEEVQVSWTAADAASGIERYEVSLDGGTPLILPSGVTSHAFAATADGNHLIEVRAVDRAGNSRSVSVSVTVDTGAPTVALLSPAAGTFFGGGDVLVTWAASDAGSGLDRIDVRLDGGVPVTLAAGERSYVFGVLAEGPHMVTVTAVDRAGNSETTAVSITVDTSAPSVSLTSPVTGSFLNSRDVLVSWDSADAGSGVDRLEVLLDRRSPVVLAGTATTYTFSAVADGVHTVTVIVIDEAGNFGVATAGFAVDTAVWSPSGPYGAVPLIGSLIGIVAAAIGIAVVLQRRRKHGTP